VALATSADHPAIVSALVEAYEDDPVMNYLFPEGAARKPSWAAYFRLNLARYTRFDGVHVTDAGRGAALWAPPGKHHVGLLEQLLLAPKILAMLGLRRVTRGVACMQKMQSRHPTEPHFYLNILGVHPQRQGAGVGAALLAAGLERVDASGLGAYLESSNERNLTLYRRHGFETKDVLPIGPGVQMWLMWREARR